MATTSPITTLDLLAQRYPVLLTIPDVAEVTSMQPQTIRNRLARGDFPIPSLKIGRRRLFRVIDVAAFLDQVAGIDTSFLAVARRRGRPTKLAQARKQRPSSNEG